MTAQKIIDGIIKREGGFVNHPNDRGGPTNFGITLGTLGAWRSRLVTVEDVAGLGLDEARGIYVSEYLVKPKIGKINNIPLRIFALDSAVQHGPARAIRWLQKAAGVPADGILGAGEPRGDQPA